MSTLRSLSIRLVFTALLAGSATFSACIAGDIGG